MSTEDGCKNQEQGTDTQHENVEIPESSIQDNEDAPYKMRR